MFRSHDGTDDSYDDQVQYWNVNTGYSKVNGKRQKSAYPLWSEYTGELFGLTIELVDRHMEWQQLCSGGQTGFEVTNTTSRNMLCFFTITTI